MLPKNKKERKNYLEKLNIRKIKYTNSNSTHITQFIKFLLDVPKHFTLLALQTRTM